MNNNYVRASELLRELGVRREVYTQGPAGTLKELQRRNIAIAAAVPQGRGVTFFISKEVADLALRAQRPITVKPSKTHQPHQEQASSKYHRTRKDVRSIARAILDLYSRLGEVPHPENNIIFIAERE